MHGCSSVLPCTYAHHRYTRVFIKVINPDGTLQQELGRGRRTLMYHAFAGSALTGIAYLARANGIDLLPQGNYALRRLVAVCIR